MKKRILSLFMCLTLILGMLPVSQMQAQAASTIEKTIVAGEPLVITAKDLGVSYNPVDYTITCFWKIKKGDIDYTEDTTLIQTEQEEVTILDVNGNCILDGCDSKFNL